MVYEEDDEQQSQAAEHNYHKDEEELRIRAVYLVVVQITAVRCQAQIVQTFLIVFLLVQGQVDELSLDVEPVCSEIFGLFVYVVPGLIHYAVQLLGILAVGGERYHGIIVQPDNVVLILAGGDAVGLVSHLREIVQYRVDVQLNVGIEVAFQAVLRKELVDVRDFRAEDHLRFRCQTQQAYRKKYDAEYQQCPASALFLVLHDTLPKLSAAIFAACIFRHFILPHNPPECHEKSGHAVHTRVVFLL